ncbi:MAG: hypothetical protein RLZZ328_1411 [Bacteroidota bacterium]|jgi:hypothetical protein
MKKILLVISGYYERFQINTIESAIKRAKYPERLSFAISHHEDHVVDTSHISNKVYRYIIPKGEKLGMNKPRSILSQFKTDEDFVLIVDSHVIFMPEWDEELIFDYLDRVENAENKNIIISGSFGNTINIGHLQYENALDEYFNNDSFFNEKQKNVMYEFYIDKGKFQEVVGREIPDVDYQGRMRNSIPTMTFASGDKSRPELIPHMQNIFSGGFSFFPSKWFDMFSISQKIFILGDQEETAINIYTTGYDIWMPRSKYHIHMADHKEGGIEEFNYNGSKVYTAKYFDIEKDQSGLNWFWSILKNMEYDDNIKRPRDIRGFFDFHKLDETLYR